MARTAESVEVTFEDQNQAAILRAVEADRIEPRAESASYDPRHDLVLVVLRGGFAFGFPPRAVEALQNATEKELSQIRISPSGDGLHWDSLDADVSLNGLMAKALNLRAWAPRILGQTRSEAKARAARKNGKRGGRPRIRSRP